MGYVSVTVKGITFQIDEYLKRRLDIVKRLIRNKWDCAFIIDGMERSGKSAMGLTCAWYISNGKLGAKNFAKGADEAIKKIGTLPNRSVLIIDEGSLIFDSKDSLKKEMKKLIKVLNVCGQKEMVIIIILPSFFELVTTIATRRTRFLIHIYTDKKYNRGRFSYFSEKKKRILYVIGKKKYNSYRYPPASFKGRFKDFNPLGEVYLKIKALTLKEVLKPDKKNINPILFKKKLLLEILKRLLQSEKTKNLTQNELSMLLGCARTTIEGYLLEIRRNDDDEAA